MRHRVLVVHRTVNKQGPHVLWAPGKAASAGEWEFLLVHPVGISVDGAADRLNYSANFRSIPSLRRLWLYQTMDYVRLIPSRLKKAAAWIGPRHRSAEVRSHG
jgi:hypothetical protein